MGNRLLDKLAQVGRFGACDENSDMLWVKGTSLGQPLKGLEACRQGAAYMIACRFRSM